MNDNTAREKQQRPQTGTQYKQPLRAERKLYLSYQSRPLRVYCIVGVLQSHHNVGILSAFCTEQQRLVEGIAAGICEYEVLFILTLIKGAQWGC